MTDAEEEILEKFENIKHSLEAWGKHVDEQIIALLRDTLFFTEIKIFPNHRLKEDKKIISKALWRGKKYDNPILDIEDKVGTRIVLLKSDDIEPVSNIFKNFSGWNSKITKKINDFAKEDSLKKFDYQSMHIVVWPLADDKIFDKETVPLLTCEIQIRTLLQHAFAEVSHDSTYKGPYKNDVDIVRKLSKSMALMEATDDYFIDIFQLMTDSTKKYKCYIEELSRIFKTFNPDFEIKNIDIELTDFLFELLVEKEILISDIEELTQRNSEIIRDAIEHNTTLLFQQPIVLLVYYYIFNHREFIKKHWPLGEETLKSAFHGFGYAYDI